MHFGNITSLFQGFSEHSNRHSRQRVQVEELTARVSTLTQENRVLKVFLGHVYYPVFSLRHFRLRLTNSRFK